MDPIFALAALVLAFVALEIGYLLGLDRGREARRDTPEVIGAMPLTFTVKSESLWQSSTTGMPPSQGAVSSTGEEQS